MSLVALVNLLFQTFYILLLLRVILSWVPGIDARHPAVQFVQRATAPVLAPIRRVLPPAGGLDLSPMVAILLLILTQRIVVDLLVRMLYY
ncbi:MAG TPA: YggT family protein [bacterium]|nr:YggT family protein [bacterium]